MDAGLSPLITTAQVYPAFFSRPTAPRDKTPERKSGTMMIRNGASHSTPRIAIDYEVGRIAPPHQSFIESKTRLRGKHPQLAAFRVIPGTHNKPSLGFAGGRIPQGGEIVTIAKAIGSDLFPEHSICGTP